MIDKLSLLHSYINNFYRFKLNQLLYKFKIFDIIISNFSVINIYFDNLMNRDHSKC